MAVDQVDPLINAIYHWMDISGVLLMGVIGGTLARQLGYDIVGFSSSRCFPHSAEACCATC